MKNKKFGRNLMSSLSSGAKRIIETVTPPMEAEEILGRFIDQELPKFLNGERIWGFSRYYKVLHISKRECILRINNREVWHIPSEARTYSSRDELAWVIMKGEASPIISPNGEEIYLYRDNLRHHTITIDEGAWIVSYRDWSGMTEKVRYTSMPEVIPHQYSRDCLREKCKDGWKGVGRLAFPDEKIVCHVTPRGLVETTNNPFGNSDWTTTGTNCFDTPYWIWKDNQAAVADTETNTIRFYSADGVLVNKIVFDDPLLSIASNYPTPDAILAVTKKAVVRIAICETSWSQTTLFENPFVTKDGTVFVVKEGKLLKVIKHNEKGGLVRVTCAPIELPGKVEAISVYDGTLVVKCKGVDREVAFF